MVLLSLLLCRAPASSLTTEPQPLMTLRRQPAASSSSRCSLISCQIRLINLFYASSIWNGDVGRHNPFLPPVPLPGCSVSLLFPFLFFFYLVSPFFCVPASLPLVSLLSTSFHLPFLPILCPLPCFLPPCSSAYLLFTIPFSLSPYLCQPLVPCPSLPAHLSSYSSSFCLPFLPSLCHPCPCPLPPCSSALSLIKSSPPTLVPLSPCAPRLSPLPSLPLPLSPSLPPCIHLLLFPY